MKKRMIFILATLMVFTVILSACGSKDSDSPATSGKSEPAEVTGEMIHAGELSALCTNGWMNFPVPDLFADDEDAIVPNKLLFRKGAKSQDDYGKPGISITHYGENETFYELNKDDYADSEELDAINLGGRTWQGFTGLDSGSKYVWLWTGTSDSAEEFLINFMCEYDGVEISLDDADLQAIIASIAIP